MFPRVMPIAGITWNVLHLHGMTTICYMPAYIYITCANIISFSVVLQLFFFLYKYCSILHATSMSNNVWCLLSKTPLGHLSFTNLILDFCNFSIYNCIEHHAAHLFHDPTKVVKQKDKCMFLKCEVCIDYYFH